MAIAAETPPGAEVQHRLASQPVNPRVHADEAIALKVELIGRSR